MAEASEIQSTLCAAAGRVRRCAACPCRNAKACALVSWARRTLNNAPSVEAR